MQSASGIRREVAEYFRSPILRSVSDAAAEFVRLSMPGGYRGPWSAELTPYLVEPMNCLTSRELEAVIFVGPAQSGKTEGLVLGWLGYAVTCNPGDILIVEKSFDSARDFSRRRIDRMIRNSPDIKAKLSTRRNDDNTYDKWFKNGMVASLAWPSVNQLSGRPLKYVALTDYDRMPEDVDGEGDPFSLARKRNTTFMSGGMTLAESSPGNESLTAEGKPAVNWKPATPHEAPPSPGIIALYNRGDRRCWHWTCPHCMEDFRPLFSLLSYPDEGTPAKRASQVVMPCPHCGSIITHDEKRALNRSGKWLAEWQVMGETKVAGSRIASFWIEGPAAAFQTWESLVLRYLQAEEEFERTGDEIPLKTTVNTDQGRPYLSRRITASRDTQDLMDRADIDYPAGTVPPGAQLLIATVDVQSNRFVVQVHGVGIGREIWLIDRFDIAVSNRTVGGEQQAVNPAVCTEDWDLLTLKVIEKQYPLSNDSNKLMKIRLVGCDSGGQPGVTEKAYAYWRRLRREGKSNRFLLLKGEGKKLDGPRVTLSYPDTKYGGVKAATARGDVPVLLINTNPIKDAVHSDLQQPQPGPGYIHLPKWLPSEIFEELTAETRTAKGWEKVSARNEAWDLLCYTRALLIHLGVEKWGDHWERAPVWAQEWGSNSMVVSVDSEINSEYSKNPKPLKEKPSGRSFINRPKGTPWIR